MLLTSSHESRAESPRSTSGNLQTIISRLYARLESSRPQGYDIGLEKTTLEEFMHEFENVSMPTPYDHEGNSSMTVTVSEASLAKAGVSLQIDHSVNTGVGFSRYEASLRQLRLLEISSKGYNGGGELRKLIWDHREPIFSLILEEIDMDLGTCEGDRSLVAVVTKKICANVGVSKTSVTSASFGASSPVEGFLSARAGMDISNMSHESFDAHHGICGVHFILFPVEVVGQHRWRFYRGIDLRDAEPQDDSLDEMMARRDHFLQSQKWHRKDVSEVCNSSEHQDISRRSPGASTERSRSSTSEEDFASTENEVSVPCGDVASPGEEILPKYADGRVGEEFVDVAPANNPVPWVDIDITECLGEFAVRQCALAAEYRALSCTHAQEQGVRLLRSSLCKACPESIVRASMDLSECYEHGLGVLRNQSMAKELRSWSEAMRTDDVFLTFWCELLSHDDTFSRSLEPEKRVSEVMADRETIAQTFQIVQVAGASPKHITAKVITDAISISPSSMEFVLFCILLNIFVAATISSFAIALPMLLSPLMVLLPMSAWRKRVFAVLILAWLLLSAFEEDLERRVSLLSSTGQGLRHMVHDQTQVMGVGRSCENCRATRHLTELLGYCDINSEALETV